MVGNINQSSNSDHLKEHQQFFSSKLSPTLNKWKGKTVRSTTKQKQYSRHEINTKILFIYLLNIASYKASKNYPIKYWAHVIVYIVGSTYQNGCCRCRTQCSYY